VAHGRREADAGHPAGTGLTSWPAADDQPADPLAAARTICLRLLTTQPRTRAQLAAALQRRGVVPDVAAAVLDRLSDVGLVDDTAFAAAWVESRHAGRGLARRALSAELRQRGVDPATVATAVATVDGDQELDTARALVRRRLPSMIELPEEVRTRRLLGQLGRRGYPGPTAARAVRDVLAEPDVLELLAAVSGPAGSRDCDPAGSTGARHGRHRSADQPDTDW
jgi:regulatory protein